MGVGKTIDIIIQARMGSGRLPGKTLLPIRGRTVLEYVVEAAKKSKRVHRVVVATSSSSKDNAIEEVCRKNQYKYFRGSEEDVLGRYYDAAKKFGSDIIVRVSADNIFTDINEADRLIDILLKKKLDYVGNHKSGMPTGTGSEVFTFYALEKAHNNARHGYEREHVTPFFYGNPDLFTQEEIKPLGDYRYGKTIRLTLDTEEDYEVLKKIYEALGESGKLITAQEAIRFLYKNKYISDINRYVEQKIIKET